MSLQLQTTVSRAHRGMMPADLRLADAVNERCPWSGDPVSADALTLYRGEVVGFCNPGCRDKFVAATAAFDHAIASTARD